MAHLHTVQDSDTHFSIDPITREIKTESKKILLIQGDHNAERFTFRLPKLVEHHDMMNCDLVTIHFINISGTQTEEQSKGVYEVNDIKVCGEDEIEFTWLISENATKYAGSLAFCIRFECTTNGVVDYRWQTGIYKNITISNSYYNGNEVTESFPDILAQWKAELFEAGGDSVVNVNIARDEALEAIKAEGTTQIENVKATAAGIKAEREQIHLNHALKASAIKGAAEGEVIVLDDSAEMPFAGMNVFGKSEQATTTGTQLFNACGTQNNAFGTAEISEKGKVISVTGTYYVSFPIALTAGETYFVDFKYKTDGGNYGIRFEYVDNSISETLTNPFVFVPEKDVVSIYLYSSTGEEKTVIYEDVQVCKGSTALPWEEFSGGIPSPNPEYPQEINSVENPIITVTDGNENEQKISLPYTLHGIPVTSSGNYTDADGQQWICDEIDLANGKYIQRCEKTVLNGETSVLSLRGEINGTIYVITKDNNRYIPKTNLLSDKLLMRNTIYSAAVEGIRVEGTESSFGLRFRIATARLNSVDVAGAKEFLTNNPIRVIAPLVEPIEIPLSEAEIEAFKSLMTNHPTTTILNDSGANMAVLYGIDTKTYIDKKFEELKSLL